MAVAARTSDLAPPRSKRYRLNRGLLLWSLLVIGILAAGSYGLRRVFMVRNASQLLVRAAEQRDSGDLVRASQLYSQYLQLTRSGSTSPVARTQRAEVLLELGQLLEKIDSASSSSQRVVLLYEEALRLDGEVEGARWRLVPLLMELRRFSDALSHVGILRQGRPSSAEQAELAFRAARCHEELGNRTLAQQEYRTSIELLPSKLSSYLGLVRVWETEHADVDFLPGGKPWWPELLAFQSSIKPETLRPTGTAILHVLDRMIQANPTADGEAVRATVLLSMKLKSDVAAADSTLAAERADVILREADADEDGELAGSELWNASVPVLADANRNGRVSLEELTERVKSGDVEVRHREAETVLKKLLESPADGEQIALRQLLLRIVAEKLETEDTAYDLPTEARRGLLDEARGFLKTARERFPTEPQLQLLAANFELRLMSRGDSAEESRQQLQNAETALRQGLAMDLSANPRPATDDWLSPVAGVAPEVVYLQLQFALGEVLLARAASQPESRAASISEVQTIVAALRESGVDSRLPLLLDVRQAMLQPEIKRGTLLEMGKLLSHEVGTSTTFSRQAAALLGAMYTGFGDPGGALDTYRRQLKAEPFWVAGRVAMAEVLTNLGRTDEAITQYESVVNAPGVPERLAVLLMLCQARRPAEARDWQQIESVLEQVGPATANSVQFLILRAELAALEALTLNQLGRDRQDSKLLDDARDLLGNAESQLRAALRDKPEAVSLWTALASAILRREDLTADDRWQQVTQLLGEARTHVGEHAELAFVELNASQLRDKDAQLATAERLSGELNRFPAEGKTRLVLALSQTLGEFKQVTAARQLLCRYADEVPDDLDLQRTVNQALLRDIHHDDPEWEAQWASNLRQLEVLEGTPDGYVLLARAQRTLAELDKGPARAESLKQVREMLNVLHKARPYLSIVLRTQGVLEEEFGDLEAAADAYREAILLGDRSKTVITRLVGIYLRRQQYEDADRLLSRVSQEQSNAITGDLARLAWQVASRREQYDRAIEIVSELAEETGSDQDLLAAAILKFSRGQLSDDVLEAFHKAAYEISPQTPRSWVPLVLYYVRVEDWQAAETAITDAETTHLTDKTVTNLLAIAQLWEMLATSTAPDRERLEKIAAEHYDAALSAFPDDLQARLLVTDYLLRTDALERARTQLTELLDPSRSVPVEVRAWARRRQAALQAGSGSYEDTRTALAALERAEQSGFDQSAANQRLQLQLLQRFPNAESLSKQADILSRLKASNKLTDEERLVFASVLDRLDRWDEAQATFRQLLESQPGFIRARVAYCTSMLNRSTALPDLLETVAEELGRLQQLEPDSWRTVSTKSRLLAARGQTTDAAELLTAFASARLQAQGEDRFASLLQQENYNELFQTVLNASPRANRAELVKVLSESATLIREKEFSKAARVLAPSSAAPALDRWLVESALACAKLIETWDVSAAEPVYQQCLVASKTTNAPREMARLYVKSGQIDKALSLCESHWDQISPAGVAYVMSMMVRTEHELPMSRLQQWRSRLLADSASLSADDRGNMFSYLGNFDNLTGNYRDAVLAYAKANEAAGRRFDSLNNFAFLSARLGQNLTEAGDAIESAIRMAGSTPELLDTRATVWIAQERLDDARKLLESVAAERPEPSTLFRLAECYFRQHDTNRTKAALTSAFDHGLDATTLHPLDQRVLQEMQAAIP